MLFDSRNIGDSDIVHVRDCHSVAKFGGVALKQRIEIISIYRLG